MVMMALNFLRKYNKVCRASLYTCDFILRPFSICKVMNKPLLAGALCAMTVLAVMAKGKASDPVLMTVAGKDVPLSEFEYLYNKNNSQQIEPQSVDEYLDMFVTYKLKVADAEAAGIDTTKKFIDEFNGYRNELAAPYVVNKEFEDSLLRVAYDHTLSNVDVSHIMIPLLMAVEMKRRR